MTWVDLSTLSARSLMPNISCVHQMALDHSRNAAGWWRRDVFLFQYLFISLFSLHFRMGLYSLHKLKLNWSMNSCSNIFLSPPQDPIKWQKIIVVWPRAKGVFRSFSVLHIVAVSAVHLIFDHFNNFWLKQSILGNVWCLQSQATKLKLNDKM